MKPIIKWTLWQRRWSTMWWSIGVIVFIFINMVFYPSFKDQAAELQKSFENMPDAAVQLIGGSTDFFSPVGFLNSQIFFLMLPLLLGILAIGLGSSLLAREEQDHTIESLLARPVSRTTLITAKALAGTIILLAVTFVGWLTTWMMAEVVNLDIAVGKITEATLVCFAMALSFGAIAYFITALGRARGASLGLAALIALGGYIISSLAGTVDWLKAPSKIFPFHYYQSEAILRGTYQWRNLVFFIVVVTATLLLSILIFRRRDIQ